MVGLLFVILINGWLDGCNDEIIGMILLFLCYFFFVLWLIILFVVFIKKNVFKLGFLYFNGLVWDDIFV